MVTEEGREETGVAEAADRYALARQFKQAGKTPIAIDKVSEGKDGKKNKSGLAKFNIVFGKVKLRDKIVFTRNLSAMLSAGLSMSRALSVMERQTGNKVFVKILKDIQASVQKGEALSVALSQHPKDFEPIFVAMTKAGEESGKLSEALTNLRTQLEKSYQLKKRIRGAMMYPSIVVAAMIIVGVVMMIFVVPTLTSTFEDLSIELPASTRLIIGISSFMKNHTILFLGGIVAFIAAIIFAAKQPAGKRFFEILFLHAPVIKDLTKETNAARTTRTLSSLLVSGVNVVSAFGITKEVVQNTHYKAVLAEAEEKIQKGEPISQVFLNHTKLYPVLVGEMVSVGEEAGNLPEMLNDIAVFYEGEVEEKTKNLSTIIEPILMVIIGAVVGFFAVSMISPIYSISSGI